jgi:hypothetical protein
VAVAGEKREGKSLALIVFVHSGSGEDAVVGNE